MLFNSFEFIIFFIFVYIAYRLLRHKAQNLLLLGASYFFYGCWNWRFLFLLFASTVIDFYCGQMIHNSKDLNGKRIWFVFSICVNLSILGFFKYFNFFSESFTALLSSWGLHFNQVILKVILPIGVSFYTFQSISYIADIYTNKQKPERNFLDYALFVSFFPQLVAGPIERAGHMLPQYKFPRTFTSQKNQEGLWFIYWGVFLKVFVADNMAKVVNLVFNQTGVVPGIEVLLGSYAFAFQIFGDFAGYSFIAMGVARLLGIELMTNFYFPYFVTNPSDFWKNWHISLSSWLRDYLYIPLGGNRNGEFKSYRNIFITLFLGGLWHGAAWTFVIWGCYQGVTLIIHKVYTRLFHNNTNLRNLGMTMVQVIVMFQITCLGWLIFRANSFQQLKDFLYSLFFNWSAHSEKSHYLIFQLIFYSALLIIIQGIQKYKNNLMAIPNLSGFKPWVFYAGMFYLILFWGDFGGKQFIYFQF